MKFLRYTDLNAMGIVNSRMTLMRLINHQNFPKGFLISPNARAWAEADIAEWIASRPVAAKSHPMKETKQDGGVSAHGL